jgi:hypothetical protein
MPEPPSAHVRYTGIGATGPRIGMAFAVMRAP